MAHWHPLPQFVHTWIAQSPNAVLLQSARYDVSNQTSYLYLDPQTILTATTLDELPRLFAALEAATQSGLHAAGYLHYECGSHFAPRAATGRDVASAEPLAWFGIYSDPILFHHATGRFVPELVTSGALEFLHTQPFCREVYFGLSEEQYSQKILAIQDWIAAGDTYQVNFTSSLHCVTDHDPATAFATLLRQQGVAYAAWLNVAGRHILSLSPELFFDLDGDRILTRPMKGTLARGLDLAEDRLAAASLQNDEKNRAEHVMIVDLMRNDVGRVCRPGSVQVPDLFTIERYETLHQMTSTVTGTLRAELTLYEIFQALFPSGSITGAPKIRTMQIIDALEARPRGIYTGAIGHILPAQPGTQRRATFNVAIRTLTLVHGEATMGVGGGIVADSEPAAEYRECLLKTAFLTRERSDFQLIETILWDRSKDSVEDAGGFYLLELHLERLAESAAYFGFSCDSRAIRQQLTELAVPWAASIAYRIRLLLHADGYITLTPNVFNPTPATGRVCLAQQRTRSTDVLQRHKTTHRRVYDESYQAAVVGGFDEALFLNERGEVTEGAISNVFVSRDGRLITPPLRCGVLPGVYRRHLLETENAVEEAVLTLEDLHRAEAIYTCNSFRGMKKVVLRP